jgi:hypothetical protein
MSNLFFYVIYIRGQKRQFDLKGKSAFLINIEYMNGIYGNDF